MRWDQCSGLFLRRIDTGKMVFVVPYFKSAYLSGGLFISSHLYGNGYNGFGAGAYVYIMRRPFAKRWLFFLRHLLYNKTSLVSMWRPQSEVSVCGHHICAYAAVLCQLPGTAYLTPKIPYGVFEKHTGNTIFSLLNITSWWRVAKPLLKSWKVSMFWLI